MCRKLVGQIRSPIHLSKWWVFLPRVERPKTTTTTSPWPTRPTSTCSQPTPRFVPINIWSSGQIRFHFQRKLMQQKTLICYSLNVALWFFGHNATTAMGQVVITICVLYLFCFFIPQNVKDGFKAEMLLMELLLWLIIQNNVRRDPSSYAGGFNRDGHGHEGLPDGQPPRAAG